MGSFVKILIFIGLIIWLSSVESSNYIYGEVLEDDVFTKKFMNKNQKLCSTLCTCIINDDPFPSIQLSCSRDGFKDKVLVKIYSFVDTWVHFKCENENSHKIFPEFNSIIDSPPIVLENCIMPSNESIYQLTSKISKNMKHLKIYFTKGDLNLNKKYFEGFSVLEYLEISVSDSSRVKVKIMDNVFENLVSLKNLELTNITLANSVHIALNKRMKNSKILYARFKEIIIELDQIVLSNRSLKELPKNIFLNRETLQRLDLGDNELKKLVDGSFDLIPILEYLTLSGNKLTSISRNVFAKLGNLKELYLDNNKIETIDDSFKNLKDLLKIELQHNKLYKSNINNLFDGLNNLEKINLSYNNLSEFNISKKAQFSNISVLDLSHNNFSTFSFVYWNWFHLPVKCQIDFSHNNITEFKLQDLRKFANETSERIKNGTTKLDVNHIICDCNALELFLFIKKSNKFDICTFCYLKVKIESFKCMEPKQLSNRFLKDLNPNDLVCNIENNCPKNCKCKQRPYDNTLVFECSSSNLQEIPTLPKFMGFNTSKTELYAANNEINKIQLIDIPDDLKFLDLRNNSLRTLPNSVVERFKTIDQLYLSGNEWTCDCSAEKLVYFFHDFRSKIVDADYMICSDGRSFKLLEATDSCVKLIHVFFVLLMGTLILAILSLTCVVFKKQIKIWLYAHNCCLWWVTEEDADKDMIYDAFFIFSHFDDNFVSDLIIDLEEKSFKCCVHHRDWVAGEMVVTQALQSIKTSRRIIVVLSPMFVQSNWATWEFRVALIHAFNQRRSRVLVIIYGNVSLIDDLDDDLRTYTKYNTYLDSEDKWFEEKLLYAMPHNSGPVTMENGKLSRTKCVASSLQQIDNEIYNLSNSEEVEEIL